MCCLQDTSWLDIYLSEIPHVVYQVDDWDKTEGAEHRTLVNKGNEAMAYLQFIIDYWGRLPASIAFIHGHRYFGPLACINLRNIPFAVPCQTPVSVDCQQCCGMQPDCAALSFKHSGALCILTVASSL